MRNKQANLDMFSESILSRKSVFRNRATLSYKFVPEELPHREREVKELTYYLSYALEGEVPTNLLILGHTGTGKTVTTLKVLNELKSKTSDVAVLYTVAEGSSYNVLASLLANAGELIPRGTSFGRAWRLFKDVIGDKITIVVLDEIDKMLSNDSNLLYHLSREQNVCIIAISNRTTVMDMILDARVLSSYNPYKIIFERYTAPQLEDILRARAKLAFYDGVLEEGVIPFCAAKGAERGGDARYSLDILMFAGDIAAKSRSGKVTVEHAKKAVDEVENEFIRRSLTNLGSPQKLLLLSVILSRTQTPSEVYGICNNLLKIFDGRTLTQRRLADFVKELEMLGFVEVDVRSRGRRKGTIWTINLVNTVSKKMVFNVLKEDIIRFREIDEKEFLERVKLAVDMVRSDKKRAR